MPSATPAAPAIRPATLGDIPAIKAMADRNRESLGFVLRPALIEAVERGWLWVAVAQNMLAGFCHVRHRRDGWTTVYEICVDAPFRRRGIGAALLHVVWTDAQARQQVGIRLKCPEGSPANAFYAALGFQQRGEEPGKRRALILWEWTGAQSAPL